VDVADRLEIEDPTKLNWIGHLGYHKAQGLQEPSIQGTDSPKAQ
jgi:hypothetical protein